MMRYSISNAEVLLVCAGAANLDDTFRLIGEPSPGDSNPATCRSSAGGVAANVCRSAAKQLPAALISAVGDDLAGTMLKDLLQQFCPCRLHIMTDHHTARYVALLNQQGELLQGVVDAAIIEALTGEAILAMCAHYPQALALFVDTNLCGDALLSLARQLPAEQQLFANTVSTAKADRLRAISHRIDCLFTNRMEAAHLCRQPGATAAEVLLQYLREQGFGRIVMTDGQQPVSIWDGQQQHQLPCPSIHGPVNVNGAGDTLTGATIAALLQGYSLMPAVRDAGLPAAREHLVRHEI